MSYSSFSSITGNHNSSIQPSTQAAMKEGQVVHGTIKQLFPNQMAEVQIGGQRVVAKLEAPLKAGDAHFFQVTKGAPEVQLKVVTGPLGSGHTPAQQAQQLLQAMNMNKSVELQAITQFFLKEQLPISKELLLQAEQLLKQLPPGTTMKAALEAIQKMIDIKVPLTSEMFLTVLSGKSTQGMLSLVHQFKDSLQQESTLPTIRKNNILESLQKLEEPFRLPQAGALLGKQISTLLDSKATLNTQLPILQALKEASVLPPHSTISSLVEISQAMKGTAGELVSKFLQTNDVVPLKNWIQEQPLLSTAQKEELWNVIQRINSPKTLQDTLLRVFSEQSQQAIFMKDSLGFTPREHLLSLLGKGEAREGMQQALTQLTQLGKTAPFISMSQAAEELVVNQLDGKAMEHAMKEVLRSLGFSYEGRLSEAREDVRQVSNQLKPQLVEILQHSQISSSFRDAAESLLGRMNGLQLLSGENGAQHQLLMQVPLELFGKKLDATLEWNGRMKEDGKIDADFARILFYLQLDSLAETVVDMQVQNRVVSITLFNEHQYLQNMVNELKDHLKKGLASVDYKLSGVFVKNFKEQQLSSKWKQKSQEIVAQGVDIRV